jgi:hypothetical protein
MVAALAGTVACGPTEVVVGDAPGVARVVVGILSASYEQAFPDVAVDGPATGQAIGSPAGIVALDDGSFYFADRFRRRVGAVSPDGQLTWVVGRGACGFPGPSGTSARNACLGGPTGLALAEDGTLLIADAAGHRVYRVDPVWDHVSTVLGADTAGLAPEGAVAADAPCRRPVAVALGPDGSIYVAEAGNQRVARIGVDGRVATAAGTPGTAGDGGDGGPAGAASLTIPAGLAWMADTLYVADGGTHRIRRIVGDTIRAYAGLGAPGFAGDRGPAGAALFRDPGALAAAGTLLFIADRGNHRVRIIRVGPDTVDTYGGTGVAMPGPDELEIGRTGLAGPAGLAAAGRFLFVSDSGGYVVRRVAR